MKGQLSLYLHEFSHLRTDRTGGWMAATQSLTPNKLIGKLSEYDNERSSILVQHS